MHTADLNPAAISLPKGAIHRLRAARGQRVEALSGCLWITIDHDLRDTVVAAGEGFTIDRDGDTLLSAMADTRFVVLAPVGY